MASQFPSDAFIAARRYKYSQDSVNPFVNAAAAGIEKGMPAGLERNRALNDTVQTSQLKEAMESRLLGKKTQMDALTKLLTDEKYDITDDKGNIVPVSDRVNLAPKIMETGAMPPGFNVRPSEAAQADTRYKKAYANYLEAKPGIETAKVDAKNTPKKSTAETVKNRQALSDLKRSATVLDPKKGTMQPITTQAEALQAVLDKGADPEDPEIAALIAKYPVAATFREPTLRQKAGELINPLNWGGQTATEKLNNGASDPVAATQNAINRQSQAAKPAAPQFKVGQLIQRKSGDYTVVGFDADGMPLLEPAR